MDEFEKLAQRRSVLNVLRPSNVTRQFAKLNPEYREQYARLVRADDHIRQLRGPEDQTVKDLLKELKKNFSNYHWLAVIDTASKINDLAKSIHTNPDIEELLLNMKDTLQDFYFTNEDAKGRIVDLSKIEDLFKEKEASDNLDLVKKALFGGIGRRLTNKFLESFQDKDAKKVRLAINTIYNKAQNLANKIINTYDALDVARAKGSIAAYIDGINSLKKAQRDFENSYKGAYLAIKEYLPQQEHAVTQTHKNNEEDFDIETEEIPSKGPITKEKHTPEFKFGPGGLEDDYNIPDESIELIEENKPQPPKQKSLSEWAKEIDEGYKEEKLQKDYDETVEKIMGKKTIEAAKEAIKQNKYGAAAVLLSRYSQELEDAGNMVGSAKILALAEELLDEQ